MISSSSKYILIYKICTRVDKNNGLYTELFLEGSDTHLDNSRYEEFTSSNMDKYENIRRLTIASCKDLYLDEHSFSNYKNINILAISFCTVKSYTNFVKKYLELESVKLSNGSILIDNNLFSNNIKLVNIDLSENNLTTLDKDLFKNNIKLQVINLSKNNLEILDKDLFNYNINLKELFISNNKLTTLDNDLFKHNIYLEYISAYSNILTTLGKDLFKNNINLELVSLSYNKLKTLDKNLFSNNIYLEKLYINNNELETIPLSIFNNNINIKELCISNNNIKLLPTNLKSLKYLYAYDTGIITLTNVNFRDLEVCEISNITKLEFKNTVRLNNLREITLDEKYKSKLKYIDPLLRDYISFKYYYCK
jgi:Leucine-rich repeat (LRR) protein